MCRALRPGGDRGWFPRPCGDEYRGFCGIFRRNFLRELYGPEFLRDFAAAAFRAGRLSGMVGLSGCGPLAGVSAAFADRGGRLSVAGHWPEIPAGTLIARSRCVGFRDSDGDRNRMCHVVPTLPYADTAARRQPPPEGGRPYLRALPDAAERLARCGGDGRPDAQAGIKSYVVALSIGDFWGGSACIVFSGGSSRLRRCRRRGPPKRTTPAGMTGRLLALSLPELQSDATAVVRVLGLCLRSVLSSKIGPSPQRMMTALTSRRPERRLSSSRRASRW